ncbi:branched-chain amino acid ABC transporter permease [Nocardioides sp.]|uniref:branched-chain amino acid ABC transporter permease n=1 Tax=Nocardioides sp. TaxID=35761 RepID=UPI0035620857
MSTDAEVTAADTNAGATQALPALDGTETTQVEAVSDSPTPPEERHRLTGAGLAARGLVWGLLAWFVLAVPANVLSPFNLGVSDVGAATEAVIFGIVGLSLNVLLGYTGQISLGHQAFVGLGAFTSAYVVVDLGLSFWFGLLIAAGVGALQAGLLGAVSLRLTGLYFALVTLAYGAFTEQTLLGITAITGGEGGKSAPRPAGFETETTYYFLCLAFLAAVIFFDWRLTSSKTGRALAALRENPRVAASYGINVKAYTLIAFVVSGAIAGLAGALLAHHDEVIVGQKFGFQLALLFVLMTVVGGLRSRSGVVIGAAFFALLGTGKLLVMIDKPLGAIGFSLTDFVEGTIGLPQEFVALVVGPILLLVTITLYPGGIGQQIAPIREWLLGRPFDRHAGKVEEVTVSDVRA